jgi:hypothetical protein
VDASPSFGWGAAGGWGGAGGRGLFGRPMQAPPRAWWRCEYAAHAAQLWVADRWRVRRLDLRVPCAPAAGPGSASTGGACTAPLLFRAATGLQEGGGGGRREYITSLDRHPFRPWQLSVATRSVESPSEPAACSRKHTPVKHTGWKKAHLALRGEKTRADRSLTPAALF